MLEGAESAVNIKNKVMNYIRDDLMTKKCEDLLPVSVSILTVHSEKYSLVAMIIFCSCFP